MAFLQPKMKIKKAKTYFDQTDKGMFSTQVGQRSDHRWWRPRTVTKPYLLMTACLFLCLIGCVAVLQYVNAHYGFIMTTELSESMNSSLKLLALQYGPIVVVVALGFWISIIDIDIRRLEPWYQLSTTNGSDKSAPLFCQYDTDFFLLVAWRAFRRKHWVCLASTLLFTVAAMIIPSTQSSMFASIPLSISKITSQHGEYQLMDVAQQSQTYCTNYLRKAYSHVWLGQELPPFITSTYAVAPFGSLQNFDAVSNATFTAATTRYWTELDCWPPQSITYINETKPLQDGTLISFTNAQIDDGRGCLLNATNLGLDQSFSNSYLSKVIPLSCSQHPNRIVINFRSPDSEPPKSYISERLASGVYIGNASTIMFCESSHYREPIIAAVTSKHQHVTSYNATGPKVKLSESVFDYETFEKVTIAGTIEELPYDVVKDHIKHDVADIDYVNSNARISDMLNVSFFGVSDPSFDFGVALTRLPVDSYLDHSVLRNTISQGRQLLFALAMQNMLQPPNESHIDVTVLIPRQAIRLVQSFAVESQAFLLVATLLCVFLAFYISRRPLWLVSNPESLSEVMLLARTSQVQKSFDGLEDATEKDLTLALASKKFYLGFDSHDQNLLKCTEKTSTSNRSLASLSRINRKRCGNPVELSSYMIYLAILILVLATTLLTILYKLSNRATGLSKPTNSELLNQITVNLLPTLFATGCGAYYALVTRTYSFLKPFWDLRAGGVKFENTLSSRYTATPAQLLFPNATRRGHYLLAALSFAAIVANLLTLSMAALFQINAVKPLVAVTTISPAELLDYSRFFPYNDGGLKSVTYGHEPYFMLLANLSGTALPPWTTETLGFLPVNLTGVSDAKEDEEFEFVSTGYGGDLSCVNIFEPNPSISANFDVIIDPQLLNSSFRLKVNYTQPDGVDISCRLWHGDWNAGAFPTEQMNSSKDFGPLSGKVSETAQAFEISYFMGNETNLGLVAASGPPDFCAGILVKGWVRGRLSESGKNAGIDQSQGQFITGEAEYNTTILSCTPRFKTQTTLLRVASDGRVIAVKALEDPQYAHPNEHGMSAPFYRAFDIFKDMYWDPGWHNDTLARDWSNYAFKQLLLNSSYLDPSQTVPDPERAASTVSEMYSRLFSVQLALDRKLQVTKPRLDYKGQPMKTALNVYRPESQVVLSRPMFIITQVILAYYLLVLVMLRFSLIGPFLPRMPFTIASQIAYFAGSSVIDDVISRDAMKLHGKGIRYGYGRYIGQDGSKRVGIEREENILRDSEIEEYMTKSWWGKILGRTSKQPYRKV